MCGNAFCVWQRFLCVATLSVCGNAFLGVLGDSVRQGIVHGQTSVNRTEPIRSVRMFVLRLFGYEANQPNLMLKIQPKQLLGYFPLALSIPV